MLSIKSLLRPLILPGLFLAYMAPCAIAETVFRYSTHAPASHFANRLILEPFFEAVERKSNETLLFELFPGGQLAGATAAINALQSGIADMAALQIGFTDSTLALSTIVEIPVAGVAFETFAKAYARLIHDDLSTVEYQPAGLVPVTVLTLPPNQLLFSKRIEKLEKLDDLTGLRVRVPNSVGAKAIAALGMVPIQMPIAETYTALERGTIDAVMTIHASAVAYDLMSVTKTATVNFSFGSIGVISAVSQESFAKLTEEERTLLIEQGRHAETRSVEVIARMEAEARDRLMASGLNLLVLPDTFLADVSAALGDVEADWIATISRLKPEANDIAPLFKSYLEQ